MEQMIQQQVADASLIPQERLREIMDMSSSSSSCAQRTMLRQLVQSAEKEEGEEKQPKKE